MIFYPRTENKEQNFSIVKHLEKTRTKQTKYIAMLFGNLVTIQYLILYLELETPYKLFQMQNKKVNFEKVIIHSMQSIIKTQG